MPTGHALEQATSTEVVAAYSAPATVVPAVASAPGRHVVGEFFLPISCKARLDVTLAVSRSPLVARAQLFDISSVPAAPVSGAVVSTTSASPVRLLSGVVALVGGHRYQIQVECTGGAELDDFAILLTGTITD